jgi:hypothetical protein
MVPALEGPNFCRVNPVGVGWSGGFCYPQVKTCGYVRLKAYLAEEVQVLFRFTQPVTERNCDLAALRGHAARHGGKQREVNVQSLR